MSNEPVVRSKEFLDAVIEKFTYDKDGGEIFIKETGLYAKALIAYRYKGCTIRVGKKNYCVRVHHVIWFFEHGEWPNKQIDHIDGDRLNNHYTNLRICEGRQNMSYYWKKQHTASKYTGVCYRKDRDIWRARIKINGKTVELKESKSEEVCARAYDNYLIKLGLDPINFPV